MQKKSIIKSFFYNKIVRFSLYGISLIAIVLAYVLLNIPLITLPCPLCMDGLFILLHETYAWQYNSDMELLKLEDENYWKELDKYVAVYSIRDRRILGIKCGRKMVIKKVLKEDYERKKREESNVYLLSDLEENYKRDYSDIESEKKNYMSLLELVEKYKKLESKVHKKSYQSTPIVDEVDSISGYTYMKK